MHAPHKAALLAVKAKDFVFSRSDIIDNGASYGIVSDESLPRFRIVSEVNNWGEPPLKLIAIILFLLLLSACLQIEGPEPYRAGFVVTKTSTESSAQEELEVKRMP